MGVRGPARVQQQQRSHGWLVLLGRKTSADKLSCPYSYSSHINIVTNMVLS
jgi:hypothetical protein